MLGVLVAGSLLVSGCDNRSEAERLADAQSSIAGGELRPAIIELKNLIQDYPQNAGARLALADVSMEMGDYPTAIKEYERAQRLLPDRLDVRQRFYASQIAGGEADAVLEALDDEELSDPESLALRGDALMASERFDDAQTDFLKAVDLDSSNVRGHRGLAQLSWQAGDTVSALSSLDRALELDAGDVDAMLAAAEIHLSERSFELARQRYTEASQTPRGRDLGFLGLARSAIVEGDMEAASTALGGLTQAGAQLPMARYSRALVAYNGGDIAAAETELLAVIEVADTHFPSLAMLGAIKYEQGRLSTAADYLRRANAVSPGDEPVVKMFADIRSRQGDLDGAASLLLPLVERTSDAQLVAMYGTIQQRRGNNAEAVAYLERAVQMAPDQSEIRTQLGMSLFADGDLASADEVLSSAIDLDGGALQSEQLLLLTKLGQGEVAEARSIVDRMLASDENQATAHYLDAMVLEAEGNLEASRVAVATSLNADPTYTPALQSLVAAEGPGSPAVVAAYEAALAADGNHYASLLGLAQTAFAGSEPEAGADLLRRAASAHPNQITPKVLLARFHLSEGRREDADTLIDEALELAPSAPEVLLLSGQRDLADNDVGSARLRASELAGQLGSDANAAGFLLQSANLFASVGLVDRARSTYQQVLEGGGELASDAGLALVQLNTRTGRLDEASAVLVQLERRGSIEDDQLAMLRSDVEMRRGNFSDADERLAPLADAGDRDASVRLAVLRQREGRSDEALAIVDAVIASEPGDLGARQLRAGILLAEDRMDEGLQEYEAVLQTAPSNIIALNNLAYLYAERDDERAIELAERAHGLDPENASIADTLGMVYVRFGQANRGVDVMQLAQAQAPDSWQINLNLGKALAAAGRTAESRTALTRSLQLAPAGARSQVEQALADLR